MRDEVECPLRIKKADLLPLSYEVRSCRTHASYRPD